ncbi:Hsp33 family molecular chaperone HslO [Nitrosomonas sp. JL21]|uniref:Hsp33 family molecular chaperone HslO n=1 Tax=Nitrosomonas sp. JL21 TaxID=153949 RepID=UPI00136AF58B|nr:Hsp33 family molecular chaperone HslO [Nitrosomonas sp. JL21]MBL8497864.1 Hsp33 family molecular chaperone HslO [Nitrosomonas sp.]MCC7091380.1 Hsp33 family molecular chaperone HslO [Nitrosomonas sp.]MXS76811.1 Hsp33 family molecular chaperone HslO [Nitrosomonas sp. JL21]
MSNYVQRFLLENLDIRGALVRLDSVWLQMLAGRNYPQPVTQLLGEMSATTLLLGNNLKHGGRLTIQLNGDGPVSMLVIDCTESLHIRGMAKYEQQIESQPLADLLGHGQLLLTLDMPSMHESYQSIVPLDGNTTAEIFEHYFKQSEQLSSRLFLVATNEAILGLLLQKLPTTDQQDPDGWNRIEALASTIQDHYSIVGLTAQEILTRLFSEEIIRIFDAQTVHYGCHEDPAKIYTLLHLLGREEVDSILREFGEIVVNDEICDREYRLDALAVDAIFRKAGSTIH